MILNKLCEEIRQIHNHQTKEPTKCCSSCARCPALPGALRELLLLLSLVILLSLSLSLLVLVLLLVEVVVVVVVEIVVVVVVVVVVGALRELLLRGTCGAARRLLRTVLTTATASASASTTTTNNDSDDTYERQESLPDIADFYFNVELLWLS